MSTFRVAFIPGLIAGVISVFTSWLWMGVIFHRYQRETPETWRPEGSRNTLQRAFCTFSRRLACLPVHARCALQSRNLCGWISGEFLLCHLHLGCPGATDSSRIRHLCSSPSPCCHRPTSRLTHHFRASLHHYMVVAGKVTTSCSGVL